MAETKAQFEQASHRLCELLNLDTTTRLRPLEAQVVPEPVVPTQMPLSELLATALLHRPELLAGGQRFSGPARVAGSQENPPLLSDGIGRLQ